MTDRSAQSLISQPNQHNFKFRHEANARKKLPVAAGLKTRPWTSIGKS